MDVQIIAGMVSTMMFVSSNFPMLYKVLKTKDLRSYSIGNITLSNLGNFIYWFYVASLPFGPVWFLHGFNTLTTAMMLFWYMQYQLECSFSPLPKCRRDNAKCFASQ